MDTLSTSSFCPPPDYTFEPELQAETPRPIPPELYRGRYARSQYNQIVGVLIAGALCVACSWLPLIRTWSLYLLPLYYLDWIGAALLVFAFGAYVVAKVRRGPFRYVIEGVPIVVRILDLELRPTAYYNGTPASYRYFAKVGYLDAASGEMKLAELASSDVAGGFKDGQTCTYRVGDYATAVGLPHDPIGTLKLYGFLGLRPGIGLVKRDTTGERSNLLANVAVILVMFGVFFALGWDVFALERYRTIEMDWSMVIPAIAGGIVLGGPILYFLWWEMRKSRRKLEERNQAALAAGSAVEQPASIGVVGTVFVACMLLVGMLGLGGGTAMCWALTLNAWLDTSRSKARPIVIDEMIHTTYNGVFRQYTIKYRFLDDPTATMHDYLSTPDEMMRFLEKRGWAEQKEGAFGWPWVESLSPMAAAQR